MSMLRITVNAKTLFPIEHLKKHLREAFRISDVLGSAIITRDSRPAYAVIPLTADLERIRAAEGTLSYTTDP